MVSVVLLVTSLHSLVLPLLRLSGHLSPYITSIAKVQLNGLSSSPMVMLRNHGKTSALMVLSTTTLKILRYALGSRRRALTWMQKEIGNHSPQELRVKKIPTTTYSLCMVNSLIQKKQKMVQIPLNGTTSSG